jgi:acylphosphatase
VQSNGRGTCGSQKTRVAGAISTLSGNFLSVNDPAVLREFPDAFDRYSAQVTFDQMVTTSTEKLARRFVVRGRVQGVGFRWFVEREAHILGIAGWVRNNSDSSVEVLAMGTRDQLAGLRSRLREGPRAARVDDVEESEAKPVSGLTTFRIEGAW